MRPPKPRSRPRSGGYDSLELAPRADARLLADAHHVAAERGLRDRNAGALVRGDGDRVVIGLHPGAAVLEPHHPLPVVVGIGGGDRAFDRLHLLRLVVAAAAAEDVEAWDFEAEQGAPGLAHL